MFSYVVGKMKLKDLIVIIVNIRIFLRMIDLFRENDNSMVCDGF